MAEDPRTHPAQCAHPDPKRPGDSMPGNHVHSQEANRVSVFFSPTIASSLDNAGDSEPLRSFELNFLMKTVRPSMRRVRDVHINCREAAFMVGVRCFLK